MIRSCSRRLWLFNCACFAFVLVIAWAQSDECFRKYPNCIIVNWQPYDRETSITEAGCKQRCLAQQQPEPAATRSSACASFVYDVQRQVCDLFDRVGKTPPAMLIQFPGRDYYEPTGLCNGTTASPAPVGPAPPGTVCGSGQLARFTRLEGFELDANDDAVIANVSEQECVKICSDNKNGSTTLFCRSFDYRSRSRECAISKMEALVPAGRGIPKQTPGSAYYQKFCIPESAAVNCPEIVNREAQTVLNGVADVVIQANSLEECVALCYGRDVPGGPCLAGMYFVEAMECILASKDSKTNPELKIPQGNDELVDYFEIGCTGRGRVSPGGRGPPRPLPRPNFNAFISRSRQFNPTINRSLFPVTPGFGNVSRRSLDFSSWNPLGQFIKMNSTTPSYSQNSLLNDQRWDDPGSAIFSSFNVSCPIGQCCPVWADCLRGLRRLADGSTQWCTNPC